MIMIVMITGFCWLEFNVSLTTLPALTFFREVDDKQYKGFLLWNGNTTTYKLQTLEKRREIPSKTKKLFKNFRNLRNDGEVAVILGSQCWLMRFHLSLNYFAIQKNTCKIVWFPSVEYKVHSSKVWQMVINVFLFSIFIGFSYSFWLSYGSFNGGLFLFLF